MGDIDVVVQASTIDLSFLSESDLKPVGEITAINLSDLSGLWNFIRGAERAEDALVYGKIDVKNQGDGTVSIEPDRYDFEITSGDFGITSGLVAGIEQFAKNAGNALGYAVAEEGPGWGTPFWIYFEGTTRIGNRYHC